MNSFMKEHLRRFGLVKAMERSIHSARVCFGETLRKEGKMSVPEYAILDYWYKFLTNKEPKYPTGFDTSSDLICKIYFLRFKKVGTVDWARPFPADASLMSRANEGPAS